jgi:anti-sigma regulatory factor (Ser/Thr protein kinase)
MEKKANNKVSEQHTEVDERVQGEQVPVGGAIAGESAPEATVSVSSLVGRKAVHQVVRELDVAKAKGPEVISLSFAAERVDPNWGAVLSVVLASKYADLPLRVSFPDQPVDQLKLARSGIFFALSRHRALQVQSEVRDRTLLEAWRHNWTPADYQQPLFSFPELADTAARPTKIGSGLVAFLNPDRVPPIDRRLDTEAVMFPWLTDLMRQRRMHNTRAWRQYVCRKTSYATSELLDNVREHARLSDRGLCSLSAFVSRDNRLHLSATDTGQGVLASLGQQLPGLEGEEALRRVLSGEPSEMGRGRGYGLSSIVRLVRQLGPKAGLFVASGTGTGRSVIVDYRGGTDTAPLPRAVEDLTMHGTVVALTIPLGDPTTDSGTRGR